MSSPLNSFVGQQLIWLPTATFRAHYDLIAPDNSSRANLDMSSWTTKAHANIPEGTLYLHKEGVLKVALSLGEQGPQLATYQRKWAGNGGELFFPDGRTFQWSNANFWGTRKAWTDPTGNTAYLLFSTNGFSRKVTVDLLPPVAGVAELSFLLVLGLYDILVRRRNAAIAASAAGG